MLERNYFQHELGELSYDILIERFSSIFDARIKL